MLWKRRSRKVFCIGFNKTGTTSLHQYFCASELSSLHNPQWPHWSFDAALKPMFRRWTCYSDGQQSNFRNLEEWFPGSLFILNTRAVRPWLRSRIKHVLRWEYSPEFDSGQFPLRLAQMAMDLFTAPEVAIDKWILERTLYHRAARRNFQDRANFIEIDITADPNWPAALRDFLGSAGFHISSDAIARNIHAIPSRLPDEAVADQAKMQHFFALADARIEAVSRTLQLD